jgi:Region in Clathrin and VPS
VHKLHLTMQVELYAEYAPKDLLPFLQSSKQYHVARALDAAQSRGLVPEQVFLLGRLNRAREALRLIVQELGDVPRAIAFVSAQADDALWDELISLVTSSSQLTGELLDQVGGHVDPLRLMRAIPDDLRIPDLHARLARILKRFRASVQLKQRCNGIIEADCMQLSEQLLRARQQPPQAVYVWDARGGEAGDGGWCVYNAVTGALAPCAAPPEAPAGAIDTFGEPAHTLTAGPRGRVAAAVATRLAREQRDGAASPAAARGRASGWCAFAAPASQASLKEAEGERGRGAGRSGGMGMCLWSGA